MDGLRATSTIVRRLAIVLILGAAFIGSAMITVYGLFHSGQVRVPNVVGMSEGDARRSIESAGLEFKTRRVHFDVDVAQGAVSDQDPAANFPVKAGYQVKVDLSKGPNPTGEPEEQQDIPIGPNVPVEANANKPTNKNTNKPKRPDSANVNGAGASNTNGAKPPAHPPDGTQNKNAAGTGDVKPKPKPDAVDDAKPKPKPPAPKPPPVR